MQKKEREKKMQTSFNTCFVFCAREKNAESTKKKYNLLAFAAAPAPRRAGVESWIPARREEGTTAMAIVRVAKSFLFSLCK